MNNLAIPSIELGTGIFTHHLVQGISTGSADRDGDGKITVSEIAEYLQREVPKDASGQTPHLWADKVSGTFLLAENRLIAFRREAETHKKTVHDLEGNKVFGSTFAAKVKKWIEDSVTEAVDERFWLLLTDLTMEKIASGDFQEEWQKVWADNYGDGSTDSTSATRNGGKKSDTSLKQKTGEKAKDSDFVASTKVEQPNSNQNQRTNAGSKTAGKSGDSQEATSRKQRYKDLSNEKADGNDSAASSKVEQLGSNQNQRTNAGSKTAGKPGDNSQETTSRKQRYKDLSNEKADDSDSATRAKTKQSGSNLKQKTNDGSKEGGKPGYGQQVTLPKKHYKDMSFACLLVIMFCALQIISIWINAQKQIVLTFRKPTWPNEVQFYYENYPSQLTKVITHPV